MGVIGKFVDESVKHGSVIYTDRAAFYNRLAKSGYFHGTVNHSKAFKDPETGVCTNLIEGTWGLYRQWISSMHGLKGGIAAHKRLFNQFAWLRSFTYRDPASILKQIVRALGENKQSNL